MTPPLTWACALLLIPLFAACDRVVGGAGQRSRGMIAAVVGGGVFGYLAAGPALAACGLVWMVWRSLPFSGGSAAPTTGGERLAAVVRHLPALLVLVPAYWAHAADLMALAVCMAGFVLVSAGLALFYGQALIKARAAGPPIGDENQAVEILRGAAFGAALAVWVLA